ncbi:MAG TPA: radical SAM protein [Planctomycetota bacterium]|nr:radical SAM protein [Planctomycetota bacterium]
MSKSIYLINPAADFPTYYGAEAYAARGFRPAAFLADLVVPTLAAMVPGDFHVELCDEHLEPVDFDLDVDYVGITGKISQWGRTRAIAAEFRRRGKVVLIGGPHASLNPEAVRGHCDVLVRDEIEELAPELFADLRQGTWKDEYRGGKPDLALTPVPRWDLYAKYNDRVLTATVQTARGCPYTCEFCDVIEYVGRQQRHKPIAHILAELEACYAHGYRSVLLADDNTTANRRWVKEFLAAAAEWNAERTDGRMALSTQLSIDAARDEEVLELCARAGMTHVFIGIETTNEASLIGATKVQNVRKSLRTQVVADATLVDQVERFYAHGIGVTAGMICGFDQDGLDIFDRQLEFAEASAIPILTLSALAAPHATPLHARLAAAGRLVDAYEVPGHPWNSNVVPAGMTREELSAGIRRLVNQLYRPEAFGERLVQYTRRLQYASGARPDAYRRRHPRSVDRDTLALIGDIPKRDAESARMWKRVMGELPKNPLAGLPMMEAFARYAQIRFLLEDAGAWEPERATARV